MAGAALAVETWPIGSLRPYKGNSRKHPQAQIDAMVASIRQFGFTSPLLISDDGEIVAGHGRLEAAKRAGMRALPCVVIGHLTPQQRRAYVIADNKLALMSEWDEDALQRELDAIAAGGFDISSIGFDASALDEIIAGGFDQAEVDANAASQHSEPERGGDESATAKPSRNVFPLVLALTRRQYERWQAIKGDTADDLAVLDGLMDLVEG